MAGSAVLVPSEADLMDMGAQMLLYGFGLALLCWIFVRGFAAILGLVKDFLG